MNIQKYQCRKHTTLDKNCMKCTIWNIMFKIKHNPNWSRDVAIKLLESGDLGYTIKKGALK